MNSTLGLGAQSMRNLAVSLMASKHNLAVGYAHPEWMVPNGISLYRGAYVYTTAHTYDLPTHFSTLHSICSGSIEYVNLSDFIFWETDRYGAFSKFMVPKRRCWNVEKMWVRPFVITSVFQNYTSQTTILEGRMHISERIFEALFRGVSTRFGLQNVEKCFENAFWNVSLPNEDLGRRNKRWNADFRVPFKDVSTQFWATKRWKVLRKSGLHLLFILPKSSFGEHKMFVRSSKLFVWGAWKSSFGVYMSTTRPC